MLGRDDVRGKVEIDPAGVQVQRQPHGAAAVVDHRIAARDGEPADRVEIDRPGDVVQGLVLPHAGRIQQADADLMAPYFVFEACVDRGAQHTRYALGRALVELQYVDVEVGRLGAVLGDRHTREGELLRRITRYVLVLAPADEAQVVHRQRCLQVGQDVVRGSEVDREAVAGGRGGLEADVVHLVDLFAVVVEFGLDVEPCGRDVQPARGVDQPAFLVVRYVELREIHPRTCHAHQEFCPHTDV